MNPIAVHGFGTKAETLSRLRPVLRGASILDLYVFDVREWRESAPRVLRAIRRRFGRRSLVVRSSAIGEDGAVTSMAGAYTSRLDVNGADAREVSAAVEEVIASYPGDLRDQVLVQPMLAGIAMSGVVMTYDLSDGAPYYVVNYDDESGKTDTITGGTGVNKTVLVYRDTDPSYIESPRIRGVVELAHELERICGGVPLDIEFCVTHVGELHLLQVRRISVTRNWREEVEREVAERLPHVERFLGERAAPRPGILGRRTILGVMPDWNPAEIIGTVPSPLAASLYRELITRSVWREAREAMGYRALPAEELMMMLSGRPYIDVRSSFNSFLPAGLPEEVGARVVDAWLDRLEEHPELHDKVEFEVAHTCIDFTFQAEVRERYGRVLYPRDLRELTRALRAVTLKALDLGPGGTLPQAEAAIRELESRQAARPFAPPTAGMEALAAVSALLDECRSFGTLPFSVLARHGFIAESLLRSAVRRGALTAERVGAFKRSVRTVSGEFAEAVRRVSLGDLSEVEFLARFGHLRPGTYDVQSLAYTDRRELFHPGCAAAEAPPHAPFVLTARERAALADLLAELGAEITPEGLLEYARRAVAGREHAKFVFTRNLSDALERLVHWGAALGLSRRQLASLTIREILDTVTSPVQAEPAEHFRMRAVQGERTAAAARALKLGHLVRDARDLYVVPLHRSRPNFIGGGHAHGEVVHIDARDTGEMDLAGKIVCIENADPGFDWIFGKGIAGLVTKYGGTNSHMAIRCAEFGLPAAIGCGEQVFERIVAAGTADLCCGEGVLRPAVSE